MTASPNASCQPDLTVLAAAVDVATGSLERLRALRELAEQVATRRERTVLEARNERLSWQQIGSALGVSKQSVQARHRPRRIAGGKGSDPPTQGPSKTAPKEPDGQCPAALATAEYVVVTLGGRPLLLLLPRKRS